MSLELCECLSLIATNLELIFINSLGFYPGFSSKKVIPHYNILEKLTLITKITLATKKIIFL